MKSTVDRIKNLSETFVSLLEQEKRACQEVISSLIESIGVIHRSVADRRLPRLKTHLKGLQERFDLLVKIYDRDFLAKIRREAEKFNISLADGRVASVIASLLEVEPPSLKLFCDTLLDRLVEAMGAERALLVSYIPESSEVDIIAAHNFQTTDLSLEEHSFSRTVLREVFDRSRPVLLEDAYNHPAYSKESSIRKYKLRSIIAVSLKQRERILGALYLENNSIPRAFNQDALKMLESISRFTVFYLQHARLLPILLEQENRLFLDPGKTPREIIGKDPKILAVLDIIDRIADSPAVVLIEGESGTGKELVARALHYQSSRRDRPFTAINCAAIPDSLLESELFGHEKGAFTGAVERYIGRIEQGAGGTIFLDEISELAYPLQAKLLRFLQSNEFQRLGGKESIQVDVRVVAATSKDLKAMMETEKFQEALYYRLNVIPLHIPPLRERKEEIPVLVDHFLEKFSFVYRKTMRMEAEVYEYLKEYSFPGNVRELENIVHRMVALATDDLIQVGDLPKEVLQTASRRISLKKDPIYRILNTQLKDFEDLRRRREQLRRLLAEQEHQLVEKIIRETGGNLKEAAIRLGINRITLHKIMRKKS